MSARFEVLSAMLRVVHNFIVCDAVSLSSSRHFEGSYCLHLLASGEVWYMYTDVSEELAPSFSTQALEATGFVCNIGSYLRD